jgi:8-oxo-dGTP pyrophosphatase MutT (NUDIX family)
MFGHLLTQAKEDLIKECRVSLLVEKITSGRELTLLLIEQLPLRGQQGYEFPSGKVREVESLSQAIQRVLMEETSLSLNKVSQFLISKDSLTGSASKRIFYFLVEVKDPEDIILGHHHSYAWVSPKEAVGYPISEDLREIVDLYIKIKQLP